MRVPKTKGTHNPFVHIDKLNNNNSRMEMGQGSVCVEIQYISDFFSFFSTVNPLPGHDCPEESSKRGVCQDYRDG